MSGTLIELYETTLELARRLEDTSVDEWMDLIQLRDEVIPILQLRPELEEEEKRMLRIIVGYDEVMVARMNELKEEAAAMIIKVNKTRIQKNSYDSSSSSESYFIDRKN
ncbi:hypothetical protein [Paenibacillus sinopodophylli]|uniref:hypothetical protein n=1 Tax=Paenibacillus sinopodophylli TaxID=1837342 RepID=UPI00148664FA|nr:hypothetical protein [Paenibacillus sinopodophylli]